MALKTVDLTKQPCRTLFTGCSQEEVSYAKTFWQSIQLLPPMESRLVSSDIKQRLRKAPPSRSMSECASEAGSTDSGPLSCSFTMSNSSCNIDDSLTKRCRLYSQPQTIPVSRRSSLNTQTSLNPMFDSRCQSTDYEPHAISAGKPDGRGERLLESDQKQHNRKTPLSSSGKASATGGGSNFWGAGGREFWSLEGNKLKTKVEHQYEEDIIPYSGEDLRHRKGFKNNGQQKVVSQEHNNNAGNSSKPSPYTKIMFVETDRTGTKTKFTPPHRNRKLQTVVGTQKLPGQDHAGVASLFKTILISPNDMDQQSSGSENDPKLFPPMREKPTTEEIGSVKIPASKQSLKKEKESKIRLIAGRHYYKSHPTNVKPTAISAEAPQRSPTAPESGPEAPQSGPKAPQSGPTATEGEAKVTSGVKCVTVSDYEAVGFPKVSDEPLVLTIPGNYTSRRTHSGESQIRQFFERARTMENIEEYRRLRMFASARQEDRELLHKHRVQRRKKEEISRLADSGKSTSTLILPTMSGISMDTKVSEPSEEEQMLDKMWSIDVKEEISKFEKMKKLEDPDSEDEQ